MDYQCVIVYTIITILPERSTWDYRSEPVKEGQGFARGCFTWIKRWIKRCLSFRGPRRGPASPRTIAIRRAGLRTWRNDLRPSWGQEDEKTWWCNYGTREN